MGLLNLFGKRRIEIAPISMLPKGRIATNDRNKLSSEIIITSAVWKMLEHNHSWYKDEQELEFGYIPPTLLEANIWQAKLKQFLVNKAKFDELDIRCPYKVDKLEWQQTLWRFLWLYRFAIEDMTKIWNAVKDPTGFLSIEERNEYVRDIALISAITPGRVMILDELFSKLASISQKVRQLEEEANKEPGELKLWYFRDLSEDRAIYIFTREEISK